MLTLIAAAMGYSAYIVYKNVKLAQSIATQLADVAAKGSTAMDQVTNITKLIN
jgi:hypothetical protein